MRMMTAHDKNSLERKLSWQEVFAKVAGECENMKKDFEDLLAKMRKALARHDFPQKLYTVNDDNSIAIVFPEARFYTVEYDDFEKAFIPKEPIASLKCIYDDLSSLPQVVLNVVSAFNEYAQMLSECAETAVNLTHSLEQIDTDELVKSAEQFVESEKIACQRINDFMSNLQLVLNQREDCLPELAYPLYKLKNGEYITILFPHAKIYRVRAELAGCCNLKVNAYLAEHKIVDFDKRLRNKIVTELEHAIVSYKEMLENDIKYKFRSR